MYLVLYLMPLMKKINMNKTEINKFESINTLKNISIFPDKKPKDMAEMLPDMEKNSEIAYNIKKMSDSCGLKLKKMSFGESQLSGKQKEKVFSVPVTINLTGKNDDIVKMLGMLENQKRINEVKNIDFNINETNIEKTAATIIIEYFYLGSR